MRKSIEEMTLEEKVTELLEYQRKQRVYAIIRTIFNILIFFVLVVLPIWGFYRLVDYMQNSVGISLSEVGETIKNVKTVGDAGAGGLESLRNLVR